MTTSIDRPQTLTVQRLGGMLLIDEAYASGISEKSLDDIFADARAEALTHLKTHAA